MSYDLQFFIIKSWFKPIYLRFILFCIFTKFFSTLGRCFKKIIITQIHKKNMHLHLILCACFLTQMDINIVKNIFDSFYSFIIDI